MTCASCVARVEKALRKVPGVTDATVNLATEIATVQAQGAVADAAIAAVRKAGYEARPVSDGVAAGAGGEGRRVVIAALLTAPLALPMVTDALGSHWMLPAWLQLALATPVQFILGARFYVSAWKAVRARAGNMDLLVALGTSAAYFMSAYLMLARHETHVYLEASSIVITLVLLGKCAARQVARGPGQAADDGRDPGARRPAAGTRAGPRRRRRARGRRRIRPRGRPRGGPPGRARARRRHGDRRRHPHRRVAHHGREPAGRENGR
jgi:P-type Cu+ transporter